MTQTAYKQFEIKGYERMIERIMVGPMQVNPDMHDQFLTVQEALQKQKELNEKLELKVDQKIEERKHEILKQKAIEQKKDDSSYYDSEYESEEENEQIKDNGPI